MENRLVIFGAGHMGSAIARGLLRAGHRNICIIDPDKSKLKEFSAAGVVVNTRCEWLLPHDILMLAIPPQAFLSFTKRMSIMQRHPGLVISIISGVRIASIQNALHVQHVVRATPNISAEVFESMTLYCKSPSVDRHGVEMVRHIFESIGRCTELADEALIDPATALCADGPAFIAYFANALQEFGEQAGVDKAESRQIVIQLLLGTAALLNKTKKPALEVCHEVMTPGGTTERGITYLDVVKLSHTVIHALTQSALRSSELGMLTAKAPATKPFNHKKATPSSIRTYPTLSSRHALN